ncbi:MAG: sigma-70 family RNA polymerase sigma factor [Acidimicrobiales bacterium]
MLAATIRVTGDIDVAEECVQEAYSQALSTWPRTGIPTNTGAWLTTVARRKAIDQLRRTSTHQRVLPQLVEPVEDVTFTVKETPLIADDRLRLIFTCCHPALGLETQVALTLRLLCGLSTSEVARAFLVSDSTMAARLTRAKKKISASHIPYRMPGSDELPARIDAVLTVVHLVFTTGHTAPSGADLMRRDLVERSLDLCRMLRVLLPDDASVMGLLALIVLMDARRNTRIGAEGELLLLSEQDRDQWDRRAIDEGVQLVRDSLRQGPAGRFALMAAIAALHAQAPSWDATDWREIVALYDLLLAQWPSPVVALNRAVAIGFADGPASGLHALESLDVEPHLSGYCYFESARADFLRRLDRVDDARTAYQTALAHCANDVERAFLARRLDELAR